MPAIPVLKKTIHSARAYPLTRPPIGRHEVGSLAEFDVTRDLPGVPNSAPTNNKCDDLPLLPVQVHLRLQPRALPIETFYLGSVTFFHKLHFVVSIVPKGEDRYALVHSSPIAIFGDRVLNA